MLSTETNSKIHYRSIYNRREYTRRQLCNNLGKEVRTHRIHVVIHLSQEHGTLIRENKNDTLHSVEGNSHSHEEKSTISVLHALRGFVSIVEKDDSEGGSDNGNNELDNGGLGQSDLVEEVSSQEKAKLIEPGSLLITDVSTGNF